MVGRGRVATALESSMFDMHIEWVKVLMREACYSEADIFVGQFFLRCKEGCNTR